MKHLLSKIPSINKVLLTDTVKQLLDEHPEIFVKDILKKEIDNIKVNVLQGKLAEIPSMEEIIKKLMEEVKKQDRFSLRRVINATGTILHTNLGRSLLSDRVKEHLTETAFNYSNLEFDIEGKKRGSRYNHLTDIIKRLTGAEDVLVVNNNAAAVMLTLNTLSKDREIIVSRGELVEIGGAFRIPEIIKLSGGIPNEIGTTNKTHLKDYISAINENTAALLKVHTSNYKITGFTKEVTNKEVAELAHEHGLIAINDLGSGQFIDFREYGLPYEPTVKEVLDSGMDVVTFSGDKLLGGPQAGIIVGKKNYIEEMKKNQLTRALRVDKMTIAALEATLKLYLDKNEALKEIPTLHMISISKEKLLKKAKNFVKQLKNTGFLSEIIEERAEVGGGSYPSSYLESIAVKLTHNIKSSTEIEKKLLEEKIPIITRIKENSIILDMRTLREDEFGIVVESLSKKDLK
ncbi:L-seryl-tRNA(Sec) selenium transferase [Leptotrichia sp. OH3620_COT-345]|uniref:L-seryl-tRNA(Sec) selenium transferase n=1 Tax=Leptotrichia sp. OH3620_COT-345 TaxID=2491048 RepID=UPI000F654593|nr:L-seryl-tRNA(Sec) selenium transferase [Leptotrichia sp. OH3620_COT-345]RRD39603.1 L-seryl-tRNA(Sec) selenium transferase [Leptotrichia sp. OH3620_COT-345]